MGARSRARRSDWTLPARDACRPCALSAGRAPRPVLGRSEGGEEGRWAPRGAYCYSLACPDPLWGPRSRRRRRAASLSRDVSTGRDWATVSADRFLGWTGVGPPAQGRWRIGRPSTRPVLKHGPRSLTCARVVGSYETRRRSESEGRPRTCSGGIPSPRAAEWGAPPARLVRAVGEAEQERARWDPKDGELCLSRTKPEETLVEVRSDSDVQIDRQTWV